MIQKTSALVKGRRYSFAYNHLLQCTGMRCMACRYLSPITGKIAVISYYSFAPVRRTGEPVGLETSEESDRIPSFSEMKLRSDVHSYLLSPDSHPLRLAWDFRKRLTVSINVFPSVVFASLLC